MAKKKNILLTHGSLHVPADQMMSIDIEGAPTLVKQVSIYDFNHELLYNKTATSGKELSQGEITKIQRILNRARVLVGHSLDSDLMALRRRGVYLYNDTRCLDTYFTLLEMKAEGLLDNRYTGSTLKETALYFHIRANDYHTSHTDALATAVVVQEMMKQGDGMVVEITPSIIQIPRPPFGMEPDWEKEERGDMQQNKSVGSKADSRVYQNGDFYECVIAGGQGPTFVRMTREEYDLFLRIRELRPDYTVRLYNETILTPSIVARLAALEEAEKTAEAAPVASMPEIAEESEEIEVASASVSEDVVAAEVSTGVEETHEQAGEAENSISEEIEEMPIPAAEEKAAPEENSEEPSPMVEIEESPVADEEPHEAERGEETSAEMAASETEAEEVTEEAAAEEGHSEDVASPVEELLEVPEEETDIEIISGEASTAEAPWEEVADAESAAEEVDAETEALTEEISLDKTPAPVPLEESEIPVDVEYWYEPKVGTYVSVYPEGKAPVEALPKAADEENPISFDVEEATVDGSEEWPSLPEESLELASEIPAGGASEPLFGEGIWDLPEDFPAPKKMELSADEHKAEKKKDPAEEDELSMSLFFEPESEGALKA